MEYTQYGNWADQYKQTAVQGRYVTLEMINSAIEALDVQGEILGYSVENRPISVYYFGNGPQRVAIWSQMHGNESTCTKALLDLMAFLQSNEAAAMQILQNYRIAIIPMLNPDGAQVYTRVNANEKDINRDFVAFEQPESRILEAFMQKFQPHWGYNMHDQRSIFGVGDTGQPASISFLTPSFDASCAFNSLRIQAAERITAMNDVLQNYIPACVGRFDDAFNPNCVGDHYTANGVAVILFEAGHTPGDYARELTRKWVFIAMLSSWIEPIKEVDDIQIINNYLIIPQNSICFLDILYKNVAINYENTLKLTNFASHFRESVVEGQFVLEAILQEWPKDQLCFAHHTIDAEGAEFQNKSELYPKFGNIATFDLGNDIKIVNGLIKI